MNRDRLKEQIIELAHYYRHDITTADLDIYANHLQDMDEQTFRLAIDRHIETSEWMPKVSQIRESAMTNLIKKAGVPSPAQAWGEVSKNLRHDTQENYGTLQSVNRIGDHTWSHPIVRKAAEQIGWLDMWLSKDSNTVSNRARYMDAYQDLVADLKNHYTLTPELRAAIEPPEQPRLTTSKPEVPVIENLYGDKNFSTMPKEILKRVQEKIKQPQKKMEIKQ